VRHGPRAAPRRRSRRTLRPSGEGSGLRWRLYGSAALAVGRAFCGAIVEWIAEPDPALGDPTAPHEQGRYVAPAIEVVA
jgi:hypothetical protein